jgi:GNAT superfamily N-acetyltransferase
VSAIVRRLRGPRRATVARAILEALPAWFGIRRAREGYIAQAARAPMFVCEDEADAMGFLVLQRHTAAAWEIAVMAVRPDRHRRGAGRALVAAAAAHAAARGAAFLTVKTLAPSSPYRPYARTRAFYRAMGFLPLEVFPTLWSRDDPCLLMALPLAPSRRRRGTNALSRP